MDNAELSARNAKIIHTTVERHFNYFRRLKDRLGAIGFRDTDALYQLVDEMVAVLTDVCRELAVQQVCDEYEGRPVKMLRRILPEKKKPVTPTTEKERRQVRNE